MSAITVAELSVEDMPINCLSGTPKRRAKVYIRGTSVTADDTLDLSSYISGVADVEGIVYETDDGAAAATAATWSTYTLTVKVTATAYEGCFVVTFD